MNKLAAVLSLALIIIISAAGGFYANRLYSAHTRNMIDVAASNQAQPYRPDFSLPNLNGKLQSINNWDGKVIMVNFWASWCPPCRREIPSFIRLYKHYKKKGFVIVGVALDNSRNVREFLNPLGINYPVLLGGKTGVEISNTYGNQLDALPFTVIINRKGHIIYANPGELSYQQAETLITPLL